MELLLIHRNLCASGSLGGVARFLGWHVTVLQVRLGAKIGDLHAKDSSAFCKRLIRGALWVDRQHRLPRQHASASV